MLFRSKVSECDPWHVLMQSDPVQLRKRGLDEKLDPHELGRALYHLAQRRHFRGRDLEQDEDEPEGEKTRGKGRKGESEQSDEKAAKASRDSTLAALKANGQTLGQFLFKREVTSANGAYTPTAPACWTNSSASGTHKLPTMPSCVTLLSESRSKM